MDEKISIQTENARLSLDNGNDGIIYLSLSGTLSSNNIPQYQEWADKVHASIKARANFSPDHVLVLVDLSQLEHYDPKSSGIIYELLRSNRTLVTRTGMYGANEIVRIAINALTMVAQRDNIKVFATKEEALDWLTPKEESVGEDQ
jgi:hypothetical protein